MINYMRCSEVPVADIYGAFSIGFSDYIVRFDMAFETWVERFFGPEGNAVMHSFIAYDGPRPIGLILGGILEYEGIRTMRCGNLCVAPDYRKQGVAQALYDLHLREALAEQCQQLFLEVIVENDRAINFYKKAGYEKVYDLKYFSCNEATTLLERKTEDRQIGLVTLEKIRSLQNPDVHINWQNGLHFLEKLDGVLCYGVFDADAVIAYLCINKTGRIFQLWVHPAQRGKGMGSSLLAYAVSTLQLTKVSISMPNNASLEGFVRKIGFRPDPIAQHEMYLTL